MRKIISSAIAMLLVFAIMLPCMASVTVTNTYTDAEGCTYFFGTFDKENDSDVGLEVNGVSYNLNNPEKKDLAVPIVPVWELAKKSGKFGIGLVDSKNVIGEDGKVEVKPYAVTNGEKVYSESLIFDKYAEATYVPQWDASLSSLSVAGVSVPGFRKNIKEYYMNVSGISLDGTEYSLAGTAPEVVADTTVEGASYDVKWEYFYDASDVNVRSGNIVIKVKSQNGLKTDEYKVYLRNSGLLPVSEDSDARSVHYYFPNDVHQGNYNLIYARPEFTSVDEETKEEKLEEEIYTVLKFDITGIEDVENAVLKLCKDSKTRAGNLSFFRADASDWEEDTMLKNDSPVIIGEAFATHSATGEDTKNEFGVDISGYLKECVSKGQKFMNIIIKSDSTMVLCSKEHPTASYRPHVLVEYSNAINDATLSSLKVSGVEVEGFEPTVTDYHMTVSEGKIEGTEYSLSATTPVVEAVTAVNGATAETKWEYVSDSTGKVLSGNIVINVTSKSGNEKKKYIVHCWNPEYIPADADSDIRSSISNNVQGSYELIYTTASGIKPVIKFNIEKLSEVAGAKLKLYQTMDRAVSLVFYGASDLDWDEDTMISSSAPSVGSQIATYTTAAKAGALEVDITEYLNDCIGANQKFMNIVISGEQTQTFCSKEAAQPSRRPVINITYPVDETLFNANLSSLSILGKELEGFDKNVTDYYVVAKDSELLANTGSTTDMKIVTTCENPEASAIVKYEYFFNAENSAHRSANIIVDVTAKDGVTTKTYTVHYYHPNYIPVTADADVRGTNQGGVDPIYTTTSIYSLLKFDISGIENADKLSKVYLKLNTGSVLNAADVNIYAVSSDWDEMSVTNKNHTYDISAPVALATLTKNAANKIDITDYVKGCVNGNIDTVTLMIGKTPATNTYLSKESGTVSSRPAIIVEYAE